MTFKLDSGEEIKLTFRSFFNTSQGMPGSGNYTIDVKIKLSESKLDEKGMTETLDMTTRIE